jgi:Protein of unknown function (DUF3667)
MAHDSHPTSEARRDEAPSTADSSALDPETAAPRRFTLASLLDLDDAELAEPLSRMAPPEHRWEQLSLRVTPETGEAIPSSIRSGRASQPPTGEMDLIPGLDDPGAVEVPVYLAGRTLSEFLNPGGVGAKGGSLEVDGLGDWRDVRDALDPPLIADVEERAVRPRATPARPLAIATKSAKRPRRRMDPPVANFEKSESASVLWPRRRTPTTPGMVVHECERCRSPFAGDKCESCGHTVSIAPRSVRRSLLQRAIGYVLDHDNRAVRTLGALVLAPGELTGDYLGGHRRRYFSPAVVASIAVVVLALTCTITGLRPRPDRSLKIGDDRTELFGAGLVDRQINGTMYEQPDAVRDTLQLFSRFPVLWIPLMLAGVVGVIAIVRITQRRDGPAEMVFAAHFSGVFVLWWAIGVPLLLLCMRWGFEYAAHLKGLTAVRYVEDGQVAGLSRMWNTMRAIVIAPAFHSALLAAGLVPWCAIAYRRAFEDSWPRAIIAGLLTVAVPIILLLPFA